MYVNEGALKSIDLAATLPAVPQNQLPGHHIRPSSSFEAMLDRTKLSVSGTSIPNQATSAQPLTMHSESIPRNAFAWRSLRIVFEGIAHIELMELEWHRKLTVPRRLLCGLSVLVCCF